MMRRIQERVDLGDTHALCCLTDFYDVISCTDGALLQDAEIESGPSTGCQQRRHARLVRPDADAVARHPRLRHLEQRGADPIAVADAHCGVRHAFDREVLAEISVDETGALQLRLPMAIRFDLVDEHGPLLAPVSSQVTL